MTARAKLKLGLFAYPVLQAADVLVHGYGRTHRCIDSGLMLYRATQVPVGEDQVQHLEFVRECANNFNAAYGATLKEPKTLLGTLLYSHAKDVFINDT